MKVTCLLGSPRPEGNSAAIANRFCETAKARGAEVVVYPLNKLDYRGCQGCMACKKKLDRCVLEDDLAEVLDAVRETDVLVLATPVYYMEVSSQLKAFIDRTYSFVGPDYMTNPEASRLSKGKVLVFIQTQEAESEQMCADIYPRYDFFFKWYGFEGSHLLRACGAGQEKLLAKDAGILTSAEEKAREVCAGFGL